MTRPIVILLLLGMAAWVRAGELHEAARAGDAERVQALLNAGARVDEPDVNKCTALEVASNYGHAEVARVLLLAGADPNAGAESLTPLWGALARGHSEVALVIAEKGGTVQAEMVWDVAGWHWDKPRPANVPVLLLLLQRGGDPYVVPTAAALFEIGPAAGPAVVSWLEDPRPHVHKAALLALRRITGENDEVLTALTKHPDALETLGWQGRVTGEVIEALTRGLEATQAPTRLTAARACTRLRWSRKHAKEYKGAHMKLLRALGKARKNELLKPLVIRALAAVNCRVRLQVPGHPGGRAERRAKAKKLWRGGGERAVELGLEWLARHQDEDGRWDGDGFQKHDPADDRCDGAIGRFYDVGLTGLAALAFLGAGCDPRGEQPHDRALRMALTFFVNYESDGEIGSRSVRPWIYNHVIATQAMCEAAMLTGHPGYEDLAKRAVAFVLRAKNPVLAWRYEPRGGENCTSVTAWCLQALHLGRLAGFEVAPEGIADGLAWIHKVTDPEHGVVGYDRRGEATMRPKGLHDRFPVEKTRAMTAAGVFCRLTMEERARKQWEVLTGLDRCFELPPVWNPDDGSIDHYYWYFATLAVHQWGGTPWREWCKHLESAVLKSQHPRGSGSRTGSWDPIGPWGLTAGGRVYSTALMVLALETPYRYARAPGVR